MQTRSCESILCQAGSVSAVVKAAALLLAVCLWGALVRGALLPGALLPGALLQGTLYAEHTEQRVEQNPEALKSSGLNSKRSQIKALSNLRALLTVSVQRSTIR